MKKVIALFMCLFISRDAYAALALTLRCTNNLSTSGNTVTCSLAGSTASGSVIAVQIQAVTAMGSVSSVSDGGTNTYTPTASSPCTTVGNGSVWTYYVNNASALTNPTWTVTFANTSASYRAIIVSEITGVSTSSYDVSTCASGASTVPDPGSAALRTNNELIIENSIVSSSDGVGTGYSAIANPGSNQAQYKVVSGGSWGASAFATSNSWWAADAATFADTNAGPSLPTVVTNAVTSISTTSATGNGNVTSDGGATVTDRGGCWSLNANPTTSDSCNSNGSGTGSYTYSISSLNPGTYYHTRAYATNSVGTSYGDDMYFQTVGIPRITIDVGTGNVSTIEGSGNVSTR